MIITLQLPFLARARVWLDGLPKSCFKAEHLIERIFPINAPRHGVSRDLAVELLIPRGAHFEYGLLGAELTPNSRDELHVYVGVSSPDGERLSDSIASSLDDIRIGLPSEYARGVIEGVLVARENLNRFPAGELRFNHAAHGIVGSSRYIFRMLSCTIMRIIDLNELPVAEKELIPVFSHIFRRSV